MIYPKHYLPEWARPHQMDWIALAKDMGAWGIYRASNASVNGSDEVLALIDESGNGNDLTSYNHPVDTSTLRAKLVGNAMRTRAPSGGDEGEGFFGRHADMSAGFNRFWIICASRSRSSGDYEDFRMNGTNSVANYIIFKNSTSWTVKINDATGGVTAPVRCSPANQTRVWQMVVPYTGVGNAAAHFSVDGLSLAHRSIVTNPMKQFHVRGGTDFFAAAIFKSDSAMGLRLSSDGRSVAHRIGELLLAIYE